MTGVDLTVVQELMGDKTFRVEGALDFCAPEKASGTKWYCFSERKNALQNLAIKYIPSY
jgi:hypothetical protein